jgi:hypothetical protein
MGNPSPAFWLSGWGQVAWFAFVSGMDTVVPSATLTGRPPSSSPAGYRACNSAPDSFASRDTSRSGSRLRALQYGPVSASPSGPSPAPAAGRADTNASSLLTASLHDLSAPSTWARNVQTVTSGVYRQSRNVTPSAATAAPTRPASSSPLPPNPSAPATRRRAAPTWPATRPRVP